MCKKNYGIIIIVVGILIASIAAYLNFSGKEIDTKLFYSLGAFLFLLGVLVYNGTFCSPENDN